jgi:uncharacterized FlaG/YvyC family protein
VNIDSISINIPAVKGKVEDAANSNADTNSRSANGKTESLAALNINLSIRRVPEDKQQNRDKQLTTAGNGLLDLKAVFALDKDKNVVIRFLDKKGEVVRQVPPEEYINMLKKFRANVENLFSKEV